MARHIDRDRVRTAQLYGAARAVGDEIYRRDELAVRLRGEWPELWERIDRLLELVGSHGAIEDLLPP